MKYPELLHRLYSRTADKGIKLGLENMHLLLNAIGNPEKTIRCIHVAGTNGKGSVCTKIASALQAEGFKVGLYTSPHISTYRERIQINRQMIAEEAITPLLQYLLSVADEHNVPATFFEITTLAALKYFADQRADYAVLETGLGGRLDATNAVIPILSIITSISFDHMELLGNTIEAIAQEKAGIIKPQVTVIIGPRVPSPIIKNIAEQRDSPWEQVRGHFATFDAENSQTARQALEYLQISKVSIEQGLLTLPPCRLESYPGTELKHSQVQHLPEWVVLDVAHNPDGLLHLFNALKNKFPNQKIRVLCSFSKSKDLRSCLKIIQANAEFMHITQAANPRAASVKELDSLLYELDVSKTDYVTHKNPEEGIKVALEHAYLAGEILVICGTFFIMSQARTLLGLHEPLDPFPLGLQESLNSEKKSVASYS